MNHDPSTPPCLPLVWTVGFGGKRFLTPAQEAIARRALPKALAFLEKKAAKRHARLTAVSSIARGGDVLFAESCLAPNQDKKPRMPWRCLLPFDQTAFLNLDLSGDASGMPLEGAERIAREARAHACVKGAYSVETVNPGQELHAQALLAQMIPATDQVKKSEAQVIVDEAYLECGCRTVDEADVMVFLVKPEEFEAIRKAHEVWEAEMILWEQEMEAWRRDWPVWRAMFLKLKKRGFQGAMPEEPKRPPHPIHRVQSENLSKVGTAALVTYALAARRPCLILNANDPRAYKGMLRIVRRAPSKASKTNPGKLKELWFVDPMITGHVATAIQTKFENQDHLTHKTPPRKIVEHLYRALDQLALKHQTETQGGLRTMLLLHLMASCVAALFATVLDLQNQHWEVIWKTVAWTLVVVALLKPLMAFKAMRLEHHLEKHNSRTKWVECRILAEVCNGALARWDLPEQPMDAIDEEDFPKVKRLIRSLRLLRMLDEGMPKSANREEYDRQMREASLNYAQHRLDAQANYFQEKRFQALSDEAWWHRCFRWALVTAVVAGATLIIWKVDHALHAGEEHHLNGYFRWPFQDFPQWLQAIAVMAPFVATFALGMISVLDCRRRALRYEEMRHYLTRLAHTLRLCRSGPSRLRLIEHAERMMIEEQHEWFSVTRNYSV